MYIIKGASSEVSHVRIAFAHASSSGGVGAVCAHDFFEGVDWQLLERKEGPPPFTPMGEEEAVARALGLA